MQGVLYGIFVVAILGIIRWYIQNEQKGSTLEGDKGWLAMRQPDPTTKKIRGAATAQATERR
jgi:hypothetical protein